jgi:lipopolysaccharide export system permease protein
MVFARSGSMGLDPEENAVHLRLEHGAIHLEPRQTDRYQRISFTAFDYVIDLSAILGPKRERRAREMTMAELAESMRRVGAGDTAGLREEEPETYALHWHQRIALPVAPALFGLVGVPLAMRRARGARSLGTLWSAGLAFSYYLLQTFCEFLAIEGWFGPAVAPGIPHALYLAHGIVLLGRARRAGM